MNLVQVLHSRGIIHRDLKPSNILIDKDGHLVIADFGLAKVFDVPTSDPLVAPSGLGHELTEALKGPYITNEAVGTAEYVAPEVFCGEDYSFGVDFWSLGVTIYELFLHEVNAIVIQTCIF